MGENSSEVWGGFRVARRASPFELKLRDLDSSRIEVECSHNGYSRIEKNLTHRRKWIMSTSELIVEDQVLGYHQLAEARFHLHPEVQVILDGKGNYGRFILPNDTTVDWAVEVGFARLEPSTYHPRFGNSKITQCLVVPLESGISRLRLILH